jgi:hypothetical protein
MQLESQNGEMTKYAGRVLSCAWHGVEPDPWHGVEPDPWHGVEPDPWHGETR